MVQFFSEILNQNFTPKMGHFWFFQLIKNYTETTLLIDEKIISQEASYIAQQSLRRDKLNFLELCFAVFSLVFGSECIFLCVKLLVDLIVIFY